ncbi:nucleic acid-binding domain protein [Clostridiales bacterium oral taxon 876 str. F0540]|nr:nucleic acid-binding domain protein [Clostridiales bacterium oral taxon 876 str. F0540]
MKARVVKAAAYAVVGFQTAYLMHYYPTEFIAAMLNSVMGTSEKVAFYIRFANELGIKVLPPDINESFSKFTVREGKIRFGLAAIKNVGLNVIESIVKSREEKGKFENFSDFYDKIDISLVNKRAIESLIKAGAFDCFKVFRSQMLAVYEKLLDGVSSERKKNIQGQMSLFADFKEDFGSVEVQYPNIKEFEKKYLLAMEKEMTGLYLSGHPLEEFEETLNLRTNTRITEIISTEALEEGVIDQNSGIKDGDRVIIGGMIAEVNKKITRNNDMMAFIRLEDMYGSIEVIIFPKVLQKYRQNIEEDCVVLISGRVSIREEEQPKILCEMIEPLEKVNNDKVYILVEEEKLRKEAFDKIKNTLLDYKGSQQVFMCTKKERQKFRLPSDYWIKLDEELLGYLKRQFGEENVKVQ